MHLEEGSECVDCKQQKLNVCCLSPFPEKDFASIQAPFLINPPPLPPPAPSTIYLVNVLYSLLILSFFPSTILRTLSCFHINFRHPGRTQKSSLQRKGLAYLVREASAVREYYDEKILAASFPPAQMVQQKEMHKDKILPKKKKERNSKGITPTCIRMRRNRICIYGKTE